MTMPKTTIPFNTDNMTVGEMKTAAGSMRSAIQEFDAHCKGDFTPEQAMEFTLRFMQMREAYEVS